MTTNGGGFAIPPVSPEAFIPGRFAGRAILVTGAAGGIGAATAPAPPARGRASR